MKEKFLGQHIKCFLRNSMVLEGIIEEWSDTQVLLKSIESKSLMIIHHPTNDIILTKIILEEPSENSLIKENESQIQIKEKLDEIIQESNDIDLNKMHIQQLRQLVIQQDKKLIKEKKKEHFGDLSSKKKYSSSLSILSSKNKG